MNNLDRDKIIKALVTIFGIILLVTVAAKILFKTGDTLDIYAENNPEVAYATPIPTETPTPTPEATPEPTKAPEPSKATNSNGTPLLSNGATIEGRFEPHDGFYCELISSKFTDHYDPDHYMFLHVYYYDFDQNVKDGELICEAKDAERFLNTFYAFYEAKYSIRKIVLLSSYNYDEDAANADGNTYINSEGVLVMPTASPSVSSSDLTDE